MYGYVRVYAQYDDAGLIQAKFEVEVGLLHLSWSAVHGFQLGLLCAWVTAECCKYV